jgi:hypothetical protein
MLEDLGKKYNSLFPQVQLAWTLLYPLPFYLPTPTKVFFKVSNF